MPRRLLLPLSLAAYVLYVCWPVLVSRTFSGFLDNSVHYVSYQLFFSHIFSGQLPLWTACQAGGMPLWPLVDLHAMWDPTAWLVFGLAKVFSISGFHAFQWAVAAWLFLMSYGVGLVLQKLKASEAAVWVASIVTVSSLLIVHIFSQANGYLLHCYALPWVILVWLKAKEEDRFAWDFAFGTLAGIWLSGYNAPLNLLVLGIALVAARRFSLPALKRLAVMALGFVPFAFANVLTLSKARSFTNVAREASPGGNSGDFGFSFLTPLFYPPQGPNITKASLEPMMTFVSSISTEHLFFPGTIAYSLALFGILLLFLKPEGFRKKAGPVLLFFCLTVLAYSGFGRWIAETLTRDGVILFYRNWRFLYPYLLLSFAVFTALSLEKILTLTQDPALLKRLGLGVLGIYTCLLTAAYLGYPLLEPRLKAEAFWFGISLVRPLIAFGAFWYLLKKERQSPAVVLLLGLMALETTSFTRSWLPILLPEGNAQIAAREPDLTLHACPLPPRRQWEFPISKFAPFHKDGPAVHAYPALVFDWEYNGSEPYTRNRHDVGYFYPASSHWFEPMAFVSFLKNDPLSQEHGGVSAGTSRIALCADLAGPCAMSDVPAQAPSPTELRYEIAMPQAGFLTIANGYDPDWNATVNGSSVPILKANGAFQAVALSEGPQSVSLRYRPLAWLFSFWLRLGVVLSSLAGLFWAYRKPR